MTTINFKNSVIALAIGLVTVSCGGGNKGQQQSATSKTAISAEEARHTTASASLEIKDVNINNWQAVVKAQRDGINIPVPEGWSVESAKPSRGSYVEVIFNVGGSITAEQYGQMLMDATKAASKNGNHQIEVTDRGTEEGAAVEKLSDASVMAGSTAYNWCFTAKYVYQFHYYIAENKQKATFSF